MRDGVFWAYNARYPHRNLGLCYVRLHGASELYTSGYNDEELEHGRHAFATGGGTCMLYFDNDRKVRAPFDAMRLARRLGLTTSDKELSETA